MTQTHVVAAALFAVAISLFCHAASAHAFLDRASPAVGAEVSGSPAALTLNYTEPVEPAFSTVQVVDGGGVRVDQGPLRTEGDGRLLALGLKPLAPGVYTVIWHVTSVDTHKTEGRFNFTVTR